MYYYQIFLSKLIIRMYKQILIIIFVIYIYLCIGNTREDFDVNKTFTSTDEWGTQERALLDKITEYGLEVFNSLPDKPPPSNDSETAKDEIETIKQLRRQMNDERQEEINNELYLKNSLNYYDITDGERDKLLKLITTEIDPIIMKLKEKYNRVRPYRLDTTIEPTIDPPGHPAYPSGHATQMYFLSTLLSKKYQDKSDEYDEIAYKTAKNREYAGVHYESDTEYGKEVATILVEQYKHKFLDSD